MRSLPTVHSSPLSISLQDLEATRMPAPPYFVNFSTQLETLMRESKYLDRMGFTVPEKALNVTLQQPKFLEYVQLLNGMLDKYHSLLSDLKPVEANLLQVCVCVCVCD